MKRALAVLVLVVVTIAVGARALKASSRGVLSSETPAPMSPAAQFEAAATRDLRSVHRITSPTVDGDLSDWLIGDSIDLYRESAFSFSGRISDTVDLSATIRSGWDDENVYFAVQVSDDIVVTDSPDVWRDDGVEIGLDGLNDKLPWGSDDHQFTIVADGRKAEYGVATTLFTAATRGRAGGYDIEVAVPIDRLIPGVPISGTVMGVTFGLHDDDDEGTWDAYLIWEGRSTSSSPEEFGSLVFSERPEDRIAALEAKVAQLERRIQELLAILQEVETLNPPQ